jgi:hypothetical protein
MRALLHDIQDIFRLEASIADALHEDELQDLLVEKKHLRTRSVLASLIYSVIDIHRSYPLLLPIAAASLALKFLF